MSKFSALNILLFEKKYRFQHFKESKMNNIMKLSQQNPVRITKKSALTEV